MAGHGNDRRVLQQVSNHHTSLGATQNATDIDVSLPMEVSSPANGSIGYNTFSSSYEALRPQTALLTHYLCVQSGFGRFVRHPATLRRSDSAQTRRKARLTMKEVLSFRRLVLSL